MAEIDSSNVRLNFSENNDTTTSLYKNYIRNAITTVKSSITTDIFENLETTESKNSSKESSEDKDQSEESVLKVSILKEKVNFF